MRGSSNAAPPIHPAMKKTFLLLAVLSATAFLPLSEADAGVCPTYRLIGYTPCGKPIYSYFHVCGYDSSGKPVGQWVEQYPVSCRCRLQRPRCEWERSRE
jgi:hypothetical protein